MSRKCHDDFENDHSYLASCAFLLIFGIIYDRFVTWLENRGYEWQITSLLVACGCGIILLVSWPLYGFNFMMRMVGLFAAGGIPMIVGSLVRYLKIRDKQNEVRSCLAKRRG